MKKFIAIILFAVVTAKAGVALLDSGTASINAHHAKIEAAIN